MFISDQEITAQLAWLLNERGDHSSRPQDLKRCAEVLGAALKQRHHFNGLNPGEAERLAMLMEECAEVIQVGGKILRHGYESTHPNGGPNNRQLLMKELGDVKCIAQIMDHATDVNAYDIGRFVIEKRQRIGRYMHHQTKELVPW